MKSIEPKFDKLELTHDRDYGVRYGNFVSIINSVTTYLSNHQEKTNFSPLCDFKSQININDIIKNEKKQSIVLLEMIIFISSISSNKEHLDLLENCNEQCISLYLSITEKYMQKYEGNDDFNNQRYSITKSKIGESFNKINDELYKELDEKTNKINQLTKSQYELEIKYKEALEQLQNFQVKTESISQLQDEIIMEKGKSGKIQNEFDEFKIKTESQRKEAEEKIKALTFKLNMSNDKLISAESKLESYKELNAENDRLKKKLKGLNLLKEKEEYIEQLLKEIESKKRIIEGLSKDKDDLNNKVMKLTQDICSEKDKERLIQIKIENLQNEIDDLKKENGKLDNLLKKEASRNSFISSAPNDLKSSGINLGLLGQENLENEIDELNQKISDLQFQVKKYKETIEKINIEKNACQSEKDSIYFEKEKVLNDIHNIELEKQRMELEYESKIKQLQTEILHYKTESQSSSKNNSNNFIESTEIANLKTQIQKQNELIKALQSKLESNSDSEDFMNNLEDNDGLIKKKDKRLNDSQIQKLNIELDACKKNEEDLKTQITREHELISSSFYELALQFVRLKEEMNTKIQSSSKTWLEIERRKNFPFEKY